MTSYGQPRPLAAVVLCRMRVRAPLELVADAVLLGADAIKHVGHHTEHEEQQPHEEQCAAHKARPDLASEEAGAQIMRQENGAEACAEQHEYGRESHEEPQRLVV